LSLPLRVLSVLVLVGGLSVGILAYAVLPTLIEARLAASLQERYELEEEPAVEVYSSSPAKLLLGRIDRIEVHMDSYTREGILLRGLRMGLEDVDVSVLSPLWGNLECDIQRASLVAEVPEESINEYLRDDELGLEGGEIDVRPEEIIYRDADAFFGLPASVGLDLGVVGPHTVEVVPEEVTVGGFTLPPFLAEPLTSGGRMLNLGGLPLETELVSVVPSSENALVVRAER
jgi:hypothetical protein